MLYTTNSSLVYAFVLRCLQLILVVRLRSFITEKNFVSRVLIFSAWNLLPAFISLS